MKIIVLTENHAGGILGAEHGLSYCIEIGENRFLFDTGHSDLFLRNAKKLDLNIENEVDTVVLSHGHWDHGNGLEHLKNKTLICHPGSFVKRFRKGGRESIGLRMTLDELRQRFMIQSYKEYKEIFKDVFFLGEIPRITDFEAKATSFELEDGSPDFVMDDSALAIVFHDGLIVISGCAHSGIVNIVEYAMKVTGCHSLKAVIGGFHLKQPNHQTKKTVEYFLENRPEVLIPSHCTELPALSYFNRTFGNQFLRTGDIINFQ